MKRGTIDHPKMRALVAALPIGGCRYQAVGILESLWHFTALYAYRGDIGRHSDEAIAEWIGWKSSPDSLIGALVKTGWLNRVDGPERLTVHDWVEHCDDAVRMRMKREAAKAEQVGTNAENVGTCSNMSEHNGTTRARQALALNGSEGEGDTGKPEDLPESWQFLADREQVQAFYRAITTAEELPAGFLSAWRGALRELAELKTSPAAVAKALKRYQSADPQFRKPIPSPRFLRADWFHEQIARLSDRKRDLRED